ncbi:MAG TPA: ribonuclease H-like domain-containing protein [Victivallis vadensis]|nr:ribonuclease H-like domain-containing protein [Victivallis vadensis]
MFFAFDIETMPDSSKIGELPEPEVKLGNLKDPAKIAEKQAEARAEQIAKMALNPLYGRICAAVFANTAADTIRLVAGDDDKEECDLIAECFKVLRQDSTRLVTWNGMGFDLPFLFRRAAILGVPLDGVPVLACWCRRYSVDRHIDLMQIWSNWNSQQYAKLDDVGGIVAHDHKIKIDLREFPQLVKSAEGRERILDYCEQDVRLTYSIFQKFNGVLF